jgi:hypothetical protein
MLGNITQNPELGSTLTHRDAMAAYDDFEQRILKKAYGDAFLSLVKMYDLLWELDSLACKYGLENKPVFISLKKHLYEYCAERTALANGINGGRFHLHGKSDQIALYDETHLFKVNIDLDRIEDEFNHAIKLLAKESEGIDEYADSYSPNWPKSPQQNAATKNSESKWVKRCLIALMVCLGSSVLAHSIFQIFITMKWLA